MMRNLDEYNLTLVVALSLLAIVGGIVMMWSA